MSIRFQVLGAIDLRGACGEEVRAVLVQPKRLALLAYLALARPGGFHRRDSLIALFWPESDALRARLALRQALHFLRRSLGNGVIVARGGEEVGIAGDACWCDAVAFENALDAGRWREGLALYRGDLLAGFFASDLSPDVEQWLEAERIRLRARAASAAWALCGEAEQARNGVDAASWARQAFEFTPDDEAHLRRLVAVLDRWGDRGGALREYEKFARRLKQQYDVEPADATRALIAALRAQPNHVETGAVPTIGGPIEAEDAGATASKPPPAAPPRTNGASAPPIPLHLPVASRRWSRHAAFAILLVSLMSGIATVLLSARHGSVPVTSSSLVARRFYEEGLRTFQRGEWRAAYRLFTTAIADDSTSAMAVYYAAMSIRPFRTDSQFVLLEKAARLAERAPERDRLIIQYASNALNLRRRSATAESLSTDFPNEPEGLTALAKERISAGDFGGALPYAQRAIVAASLDAPDRSLVCRACDAYGVLLSAYTAMGVDSLPAVERVAREWIAHRPAAAAAWLMLAKALSWRGLRDDAIRALGKAAVLEPKLAHMYEHPSSTPALIFESAVVNGETYAEAERALRDRLRFDERDNEATWWLITALRHQGRIREAFSLTREAERRVVAEGRSVTWAPVQAQLLFELGRFTEAAYGFGLSRDDDPFDPGNEAWRSSWKSVHIATALAAAGDTARLAQLAASIEQVADSSSFGLARRLPHHVRGLLWLARGDPARAARELRAAIYSPTLGYTRTSLELARAFLALGDAKEAIRVLREALGGSSDGPAFFVTRTEVHERLAHAFRVAGEADSAAVHYRIVGAAWKNGDPPYRMRAGSAAKWLATFDAHRQVAVRN